MNTRMKPSRLGHLLLRASAQTSHVPRLPTVMSNAIAVASPVPQAHLAEVQPSPGSEALTNNNVSGEEETANEATHRFENTMARTA